MAYIRFNEEGSQVYVIGTESGFQCMGCCLLPATVQGAMVVFQTAEEMIVHLAEHRKAGHVVPESAILALWREINLPGRVA